MKASQIPTNKFSIPFANTPAPGDSSPISATSFIGIVPGAASLPDGFPPLNFSQVTGSVGGGIPPWGRDVNGFLNQVTAWNRWVQAGNAELFDATFSGTIGGYPQGALIASITPGNVWISNVDNNTVNPDINFNSPNWTLCPGIINTTVVFTCQNYPQVGINSQFTDINSCLEYLSKFTITQSGAVYIFPNGNSQIVGLYPYSIPVVIDHPNADRIIISGGQLQPANSNIIPPIYQPIGPLMFPFTGIQNLADINTNTSNLVSTFTSGWNFNGVTQSNYPSSLSSYAPFGLIILSPGVTLLNMLINQGNVVVDAPCFMGNVSLYKNSSLNVYGNGSISVLPNTSLTVSAGNINIQKDGSITHADGSFGCVGYGTGYTCTGSFRPGIVDVSLGLTSLNQVYTQTFNPNAGFLYQLFNAPTGTLNGTGTTIISSGNLQYGIQADAGSSFNASGSIVTGSGANLTYLSTGSCSFTYNGTCGLYSINGSNITAIGTNVQNNSSSTNTLLGGGVIASGGSFINVTGGPPGTIASINNNTAGGWTDFRALSGSVIYTFLSAPSTSSPAFGVIGNSNSIVFN